MHRVPIHRRRIAARVTVVTALSIAALLPATAGWGRSDSAATGPGVPDPAQRAAAVGSVQVDRVPVAPATGSVQRLSQSIPDAAMLQPEDLRGATPVPVTDDYWSSWRPPQPCADNPYPSAALRRTDRAISALVAVDDRPTVIMADVAMYGARGADQYLRELRRAVTTCDETGPQDPRWRILATDVAGDESMLLERREYVDYAQTYKSSFVVVARADRALVVVADIGWETASGHERLVRELSTAAVQRAAILAAT